MIGKVLENNKIIEIDQGSQTWPYSLVDVVGEITVGDDIVTFDNDGAGENAKAVSIMKK